MIKKIIILALSLSTITVFSLSTELETCSTGLCSDGSSCEATGMVAKCDCSGHPVQAYCRAYGPNTIKNPDVDVNIKSYEESSSRER